MHAAKIQNRMNFDPSQLLGEPLGKLVLEIDKGDGRARTFHMSGAKCAIGSDERCEIRLKGTGVRPVHCVILRGDDRTIVRRWAGNTWLNGRTFNDTTLHQGDELRLGNLCIRVVEDERAARADFQPAGGRLRHALSQAHRENDWSPITEPGTTLEQLPQRELLRRLVEAEARVSQLQYQLATGRYDAAQLVAQIESLESQTPSNVVGTEPIQQQEAWIDERRELEQELAAAKKRIKHLEAEREEQEGVCDSLRRDLEQLRTTASTAAVRFEAQRAELEQHAAQLAEKLAAEIASREAQIEAREADLRTRCEKLEEQRAREEQESKKYAEQLSCRVEDLSSSLARREQDIEHYRQELGHRIRELHDSRQQLIEQSEKFTAARKSLSGSNDAKIAELEAHWEAENQKWQQEQANLTQEIEQLQQRAADAEEQRESLAQELSEARQQQAEQSERMAATTDQLKQYAADVALVEQERQELAELREQLDQQRQDIDQQRQNVDLQRQDIDQQLQSLAAEQQQIAAGQQELQRGQEELQLSREQLAESQQELAQSQQGLETSREQFEQSQEQFERAREQFEQIQQELMQSQEDLEQSREELGQSQEELGQSREELEQSQKELEQTREELEQSRLQLEQSQAQLEQSRAQLEMDQQSLEDERRQLEDARQALETERQELEPTAGPEAESAPTAGDMGDALSYAAEISSQVGVAEVLPNNVAADADRAGVDGQEGEPNSAETAPELADFPAATDASADQRQDGFSPEPTDSADLSAVDDFDWSDESADPAAAAEVDEDGDDRADEIEQQSDDDFSWDDEFSYGPDESAALAAEVSDEHPVPHTNDDEFDDPDQEWGDLEESREDDDLVVPEFNEARADEADEAEFESVNFDPPEDASVLDTMSFLREMGNQLEEADIDQQDGSLLSSGDFDDEAKTNDDDEFSLEENRSNTHDFLSKLGEKPESDLESPGEDSAAEDSFWSDESLFDQESVVEDQESVVEESDPAAETRNQTHDFLSKLGEKSDAGLSSSTASDDDGFWSDNELLAQDQDDSAESTAGTGESEPVPAGTGNTTHDFLNQLAEKADLESLSSTDESTDDDFWSDDELHGHDQDADSTESSSGTDGGESTPTSTGNATHDFLSQLAETSDLDSTSTTDESTDDDIWSGDGLFGDDREAAAAESTGGKGGSDFPATESSNSTHDFLSQLDKKPDFDLSRFTAADSEDKETSEKEDSREENSTDNDDWAAASLNNSDGEMAFDAESSSDSPFAESDDTDDEPSISMPAEEPIDTDTAGGGDLSIEDYMDKLLARVGASPDAVQKHPVPEEPSVPAAFDAAAKTEDQAPEAPQIPESMDVMRPDEFVPRSKAPEQNLAAMRELANASAQSAINRHAKSRSEITALTNFGIALIPMLIGGILIVPGLKGFLPALVTGIIAECVGVYYLFMALVSVVKKDGSGASRRPSKTDKQPATTPDSTGTEETSASSASS